jgi:hypothetical protein
MVQPTTTTVATAPPATTTTTAPFATISTLMSSVAAATASVSAPSPASAAALVETAGTRVTARVATRKAVNKQAARQIGTIRSRFADNELQMLLDLLDDLLPIGPDEWQEVCDQHNRNAGCIRDVQSIRRKFNKLVKEKIRTGDPDCPPLIRQAKRIQQAIVSRADAASEADEEDLGFPTDTVSITDTVSNTPRATVSNSVSNSDRASASVGSTRPLVAPRARRGETNVNTGNSTAQSSIMEMFLLNMQMRQESEAAERELRREETRARERQMDMMMMAMFGKHDNKVKEDEKEK